MNIKLFVHTRVENRSALSALKADLNLLNNFHVFNSSYGNFIITLKFPTLYDQSTYILCQKAYFLNL